MLLSMASDVGTHILCKEVSTEEKLRSFDMASLPDGMQSFGRCAVRIGTVCNEFLDGSQVRGIARFKSGVFVDNKAAVIVWTKREVDVGPTSWRSLVLMHRHVE